MSTWLIVVLVIAGAVIGFYTTVIVLLRQTWKKWVVEYKKQFPSGCPVCGYALMCSQREWKTLPLLEKLVGHKNCPERSL